MPKRKYIVLVKYTLKNEAETKEIVLQSWRAFYKFKSQITGAYHAIRYDINKAQTANCECGLNKE